MIDLIEEAQRKASLMEKEKPWVRLSVMERAMLYTVQEELDRIAKQLARIEQRITDTEAKADRALAKLKELNRSVLGGS